MTPPQNLAALKNLGLKLLAMGGLLGALAGCARFEAAPLADAPDLAPSLPQVVVHSAALHLPAVRQYPFNPAAGLDVNEVAILAVLQNPDLRAYRTRSGVAQAEVFSAGLLPDPTFTLAGALPISGPPPLSDAIDGTIGYALRSLLTHGDLVHAARSNLQAVDLDVVWQEWQVAQQARLYFVEDWYDHRERAVLGRYRALYASAYRRASQALQQGNTTLDVAGTDLTGLLDANTRFDTLEQAMNTADHQLDAELGLAPGVRVPLAPQAPVRDLRLPGDAQFRAATARMPERRPDLLALRAGYASQNARLRAAILSQFLPLTVSATGGRDVSNTYSWGGHMAIDLPIFNRNRGNIAVAQATRGRLRAEYQARLDTDYGLADQLRGQARVIESALHRLQGELPLVERTADAAQAAFDASNLPAATYLQLETAALNKRLEAITLERGLAETIITLDTVLGEPISGTGETS